MNSRRSTRLSATSQKRLREDEDEGEGEGEVPAVNPMAPVPRKKRQATTKVCYAILFLPLITFLSLAFCTIQDEGNSSIV